MDTQASKRPRTSFPSTPADKELARRVGHESLVVLKLLESIFAQGVYGKNHFVGAALLTSKTWNWAMRTVLKTSLSTPDSDSIYDGYSQERTVLTSMRHDVVKFHDIQFEADPDATVVSEVRRLGLHIPDKQLAVDRVLDDESLSLARLDEFLYVLQPLRKLQCMLTQLPKLLELRVYGADYMLERGPELLANVVASVPTLRSLEVVHYKQLREGNDALVTALGKLPSLQHLCLHGCPLGVANLHAFLSLLPVFSSSLSHLALENAGISNEEAGMLVLIVQRIACLHGFSIAHNRIGPGGAAALMLALQQHPQLSNLDMDGTVVGLRDVHTWASGLPGLAALTRLSLRSAKLHADEVPVLAKQLQTLPQLYELDLSENAFWDDGVVNLVLGWRNPVALTDCRLEGELSGVSLEAVRAWPDRIRISWLTAEDQGAMPGIPLRGYLPFRPSTS